MPFSRPHLSDLLTQVAQDISSNLPGSDPLLRFSNLGILGNAQAGLAHLHYGYLDYIAQQSNPFTATGEYLEAWGALKSVFRLPANGANGAVTFTGANGLTIPTSTRLVRGDGQTYITTASGTVAGGVVMVTAAAVPDPTGQGGAISNTAPGSVMTLGQAIVGVNSSGTVSVAFTGGADLEVDTNLRARMLLAYQSPAHGGSLTDYQNWALQVPGVSRVWVVPHGYGAGTVVIYPMLDIAESSHAGFPQGSNGTASGENRSANASGDQLAVANYIFPLQPVTALVYVVAPTPAPVYFTISGIASASAATRALIAAAIATVINAQGSAIGATVTLSAIEAAVASLPGTSGFIITAPLVNITSAIGSLPQFGGLTYI